MKTEKQLPYMFERTRAQWSKINDQPARKLAVLFVSAIVIALSASRSDDQDENLLS